MHSRFRLHALGLTGLGAMTAILVITPVLPLYLERRGLSPAHVGAVVSVMSLAVVISEVLAVAVTSRIGRRPAVIIAVAGSGLMLAWFPLIASVWTMYLNRIIFGAVRGLLWPVIFSEVADTGPPEFRPAAFAVFWLYFGVGQLIGPVFGGWLGDRLTLAAPFYVAAALSFLTLPVAMAVQSMRDPVASRPLAALRQLLAEAPAVLRTWTLTACNVIVFSIYATFLPLHAASHGLNAGEIGLIFTGGALSFMIGQDVLRRAGTRLRAERFLIPAFVLRGLGVLAVPLLPSFWALLGVSAVASIFTAAIPTVLSTRMAAQSPPPLLVPAMGGFNAAADLGFFLGPMIGGVLAGFGLAWAFAATLPVTVIALVLLARRS